MNEDPASVPPPETPEPSAIPPTQPESAPAPPAPAQAGAAPLSVSDERTLAMLAHLSVLLNLVTGFLGVIAPLVIYLIYKDRSRFVAFQSLQAFVFQLIWWGGGGLLIGLMWGIVGILSAVLVGLVCIPFALLATPLFLLMPLVALVYGVYAGIQANQGIDFRYWLVGDWLKGTSWA